MIQVALLEGLREVVSVAQLVASNHVSPLAGCGLPH